MSALLRRFTHSLCVGLSAEPFWIFSTLPRTKQRNNQTHTRVRRKPRLFELHRRVTEQNPGATDVGVGDG
jgi:hypothetical protein